MSPPIDKVRGCMKTPSTALSPQLNRPPPMQTCVGGQSHLIIRRAAFKSSTLQQDIVIFAAKMSLSLN